MLSYEPFFSELKVQEGADFSEGDDTPRKQNSQQDVREGADPVALRILAECMAVECDQGRNDQDDPHTDVAAVLPAVQMQDLQRVPDLVQLAAFGQADGTAKPGLAEDDL